MLRFVKDVQFVKTLQEDYRKAELKPRQIAMLRYAEKLTRTPWDMTEADLIPLRETGWDDRAILDINQTTAYYAYVNRVADGLGVILDEYAKGE